MVRLAEVAAHKGLVGGPFGSSLVGADYVDEGIPVIRGSSMSRGRYVSDDFVHVTEQKFQDDLARNSAVAGDLIFTQRGTLGQVCQVPDEFPVYVISQSQMRLRVDPTVACADYVYYACKDPIFLRTVDAAAIRTGVPHINLRILGDLEIPLPHLPGQRAIAGVLGALDDKIAANEQILTTAAQLEDALFRAAVTDSGARAQRVGEVATFLNRRRIPLSSRERSERSGTVPYYGAAGRIDYVDEPLFNEPIVLVGEDGTVQTEDGLAVVQYVWGPSWVNNHAHVLVGKTVATDLLRVALRGLCVADAVTGAVQPKLSMSRLSSLTLLLPEEPRVQELTEILAASAGVIRATAEENRILAALRDALLPELMSGRLRVKDADKTVEEVV